MIKVEIELGRFFINLDYREMRDGTVFGSHIVNGQRGTFEYRNIEHFLSERRVDETTTFAAEEVARMERDGLYFDNRREFERHISRAEEAARLFKEHVEHLREEIRRRPVPLPPRSLRGLNPQYAVWDDDYWRAVIAAVEPVLAEQQRAWEVRF